MVQGIGGELHAIRKAIVEVPQKRPGIRPRPLAHTKCRNQLTFCINRNINPLISDFRRVNVTQMATFFLHEAPQLINLQIFAGKISHSIIHQTRTVFASDNKQPHDGVAIQAREPFCAANRATFNKTLNRTDHRIGFRQHHVPRQLRVRFAESRFAGIAAPALNPVLTEVPKSLASLTLASEAGHGLSPLAFCGEKPQNQFGSRSWLTPRFGLAPAKAATDAGALISDYGLRWNNGYFHRWTVSSETNHNHNLHCVPPFYRAVLVTLRRLYLAPKSFLSARQISQKCHHGFADINSLITAKPITCLSTSNNLRLHFIWNHSLQCRSNRCQTARTANPKANARQIVSDFRRGKPLSVTRLQGHQNALFEAAFRTLNLLSEFCHLPLLCRREHVEDGLNALSEFCEFDFDSFLLLDQIRMASNQTHEHLVVINRFHERIVQQYV